MPSVPLFRRLFRLFALAALSAAAAGCVYRSEIRQGNDELPAQIDALQIGMTRAEVRELLGANRIPRVFAGDEWVYYYRRRVPGFFPSVEGAGVALEFEGDSLSAIRPLPAPE